MTLNRKKQGKWNMKFSIEQDDNVVIFTLKEPRFDVTVAAEVKAEFLIVCQPTVEAMIVDLSNVIYCDSAGVSALLLAHRVMKENTAPVVLAGTSEHVTKILKMSRLDDMFESFETVEAALTALQTDEEE